MTSQSSKSEQLTINQLIRMGRKELDQVFLSGTTPTLEEMNGVVDGSVLSGVSILNNGLLKRFINLGWFIWRGKIFEGVSENESKGVNRFKIGPFKFLRFHCETKINTPLVGPSDVYYLNYDIPGNPWYIRRIRDDIKKVGEGIFLGSANFKIRDEYGFLVYFGLESTKGNAH
jgi:hypothetical protein